MKTVHLSSLHFSVSINRQTPHNDGLWGDLSVSLADPQGTADWLVVYDRHADPLETYVPKERRILMVSEPPEFQSYPQSYLDQFGILLAPYAIRHFRGQQIITQTALPWFYGMNVGGGGEQVVSKYWPDLSDDTSAISVGDRREWELTAICSTKTQTKNQVRRLRFLSLLKEQLGDRLKIFGRGFERLDDKAQVIEKSRYHLALENNLLPHGWTEKTADPVLGGAFPIHAGAKTIYEDFDPEGLLWIDLARPHEAVARIVACLEKDRAGSEQAQKAMQVNKQRLMQEHNLFALLDRQIAELADRYGHIPVLAKKETIHWYGKPLGKRLLKLPRALRRFVWKMQIALLERG